MVKKLYKHEAIALLRCMIPIDFACLALALLSRLSYLMGNNVTASIAKGLLTTFYVLSIFALFIVGYVIVVTRFYRHLLTSEGYMTHTIPVKTSSHIHCKMICGFLFTLFNVIVIIASLFIVGAGSEIFHDFLKSISISWNAMWKGSGAVNSVFFIVETALIIILGIFQMLLQPYAAMAMGQKMKNKVGGAVLWYFIFYMIAQIIGVIFMTFFGIFGIEGDLFSSLSPNQIVHLSLSAYGIYALAWCIVYYALTRYNLTSKLNLE